MRIQDPAKYLWLSSFAKGVNRFQSLTVIAKSSILVVWQGFEHASGNGMKYVDNNNENSFSYVHATSQYLTIFQLINYN